MAGQNHEKHQGGEVLQEEKEMPLSSPLLIKNLATWIFSLSNINKGTSEGEICTCSSGDCIALSLNLIPHFYGIKFRIYMIHTVFSKHPLKKLQEES